MNAFFSAPIPSSARRKCAAFSALAVSLVGFSATGKAAKIGEIAVEGSGVLDQAMRFFQMTDPAVRLAVSGSIFLGLTCGLLGAFIILRRMSLMGDALGHSVLPGVAIGFLAAGTKAPIPLFLGAMGAGLSATWLIGAIVRHSRIKSDAAMGIVLAGFFGFGIVLLTRIQKLPFGNQSGLDKFLFGQAAAMSPDDVIWMGAMTLLSAVAVFVFYRLLLVTSFDDGFAQSIGMPMRATQRLLMALLTVATIISIQAVGVVLVSAMLIIPAASAYLLTDRLPTMLGLSALFGVLSGVFGVFFSFLGPSLPTGPFMVVAGASVFGLAYVFSPRYGALMKALRLRRKRRRVARENLLKSLYHALESNPERRASVRVLAEMRREPETRVRQGLRRLVRERLAALEGDAVSFTPEGERRAAEIVRNHRLWELYLTREADIATDHVHDDAEEIEHVLGDDLVRELEYLLDHPEADPHGRPIPRLAESEGRRAG